MRSACKCPTRGLSGAWVKNCGESPMSRRLCAFVFLSLIVGCGDAGGIGCSPDYEYPRTTPEAAVTQGASVVRLTQSAMDAVAGGVLGSLEAPAQLQMIQMPPVTPIQTIPTSFGFLSANPVTDRWKLQPYLHIDRRVSPNGRLQRPDTPAVSYWPALRFHGG